MAKRVYTKEETREKLGAGVRLLKDTVSTALGPRGLNVGIDWGYMASIIHDGVKIAREVESQDPAEQFAIRTILQTANKQVQMVGDGTTVSIILACAIYQECMKNIIAGTNAMSLRQGLEEGRDLLIDALQVKSIPIKTEQQAIEIATISAEDKDLGKQIGKLIHELGVDGVVTVEKSNAFATEVEKQEGMQFEKGYISPYFITNPEKMEATVENTKVLLTDKVLNNINEMLPLLKQFEAAGVRNVVWIAPDIMESALATAINTRIQGGMNVLCVKAPYAAQSQKDFLDDVALLTGGVVISNEAGRKFEDVLLEELGMAKRITSTQDSTLIVGGKGDRKLIQERIKSLRVQQERQEGSDYQKEKIRERIAKLSKGVAVINVGGATEVEVAERYERADDAVQATQAAIREGIVPGGEVIYLTIREILTDSLPHRILYNALEVPFKILLEHANLKPDYFMKVIKDNEGVDVLDGKKKDMIKNGIIDPTLVAHEAIINAISTAVQLMTTENLILLIPEKKDGQHKS